MNFLEQRLKAVKEYFKPTENVRARDFIREIPQATWNVAKQIPQDVARFGLSAIEAPRSIASGGRYTSGYHNVPMIGRINSFQDEAKNRVNMGQPMWKAMGNPMMDTVLAGADVGAFAKPVLGAMKRSLSPQTRLLARDFTKPLGRTMEQIIPSRIENISPNARFTEPTGNFAPGGIEQQRELASIYRKQGQFKIPEMKRNVPFEWESKAMQKVSRPGMNIKETNPLIQEASQKINRKIYTEELGFPEGSVKDLKPITLNGKVVGAVDATPKIGDPTTLKVHFVRILPEAQGKGLGRKAVLELFDNNPKIQQLQGNATAESRKFWEKIGAKFPEDKTKTYFNIERPKSQPLQGRRKFN